MSSVARLTPTVVNNALKAVESTDPFGTNDAAAVPVELKHTLRNRINRERKHENLRSLHLQQLYYFTFWIARYLLSFAAAFIESASPTFTPSGLKLGRSTVIAGMVEILEILYAAMMGFFDGLLTDEILSKGALPTASPAISSAATAAAPIGPRPPAADATAD